MEISRNVILDLLPLYAANEVSNDTRILVEKYLESHPDLREAASKAEKLAAFKNVPNALKREDQMEAYAEAKQKIKMRIISLAFVIAAIFGTALIAVIFLFFRRLM